MSGPINREEDEELDPHRIAHDLETLGSDWAYKKEAADLLEETKSATRAEITNRRRAMDPELSRKEAEDLALGSPEWLEHINAMVVARRDANIARARYDAARARFEAMRTKEATRRAELFHHRG